MSRGSKTTPVRQLALPTHYDAGNAAKWGYRPDINALLGSAEQWAKSNGIKPSGSQKTNIHLLLIDVQKDFCFPEGTLYVGGRSGTGAIDDSRRIAEFMYRNLGVIKEITTTLDTHFAQQIFFPSFWVDENGNHPSSFRVVTVEDVRSGALTPDPALAPVLSGGSYPWLLKQAQFYCEQLEKAGKYTLYLWPYHCLADTDGNALVGVIQEARYFHAFSRKTQSYVEVKGGNPFTENYSVLRPEVLQRWDNKPLAQKNTSFIKKLLESDAVVIAGQAASHCVKSSINDLLDEIEARDRALLKKVYILEDCMSSVVVPDGKGGFFADFTSEAEGALQRFQDKGMNVVKSTDPLDSWPGLKLVV